MAKKEETISMIDTLAEFKELKNIDKDTMISVLEDSFRNVIAKMFGTDENYDVIINPEKGDFEIWRNRTVVADDELEDENLQLTLTEARKIDADCEVGEEVTDEVHFADTGYLGCFDCYTFCSTGVNRVDLVDCWVPVGCRYSDVSLAVFNMYRVSETGNYIG